MGLGNFRYRIVLILFAIAILVFWMKLSSLHPIILKIYTQDALPKETNQVEGDDVEKVLVAVYYESLCPDSRSFFTNQLLPTYQEIPQHMTIQYVPYGNAETFKDGDDYKFKCQHREVECIGNIVHACSVEYIKKPDVLIKYLTCMIKKNNDPFGIMKSCGKEFNIELDQIHKCADSIMGRKLLAEYGNMTLSLEPAVSFIPTITLNQSSENQVGILKNLLKEVCLKLKNPPKACK